ncbi:MAG: chromosome partitioning protein ParB, partial [Ruminococcus sp.]|nr:chromosome partitioning protein ParB [Candidatus Copronaster equi]
MGKNKSAAKIEMKKFDDLFETDESREDKSRERLIEVELDRIRDFPEHPYLVKDDESMAELID